MSSARIDWQSISEPNLYGWEATIGNRRAQVVRAYENTQIAHCKRTKG